MKDYLLGIVACAVGVICHNCLGISFVVSLLFTMATGASFVAIDYGIKKLKSK